MISWNGLATTTIGTFGSAILTNLVQIQASKPLRSARSWAAFTDLADQVVSHFSHSLFKRIRHFSNFLNSCSRKIAENSVRVALGKLRLRDCKQNVPLCLPTKIQNKNWQKFDFENFGHVEASSKCDFLTVSSLFIPEITCKTIGETATKFEESEVFSQSAQKSKFSAEFSSSRCLFSAIYCASSTLHIQ